MKNQYFGDEHDYLKYGLLHLLYAHFEDINEDNRLFVSWYLTDNDIPRGEENTNAKGDGNKRSYLEKDEEYKYFDPELYECLQENHEKRNIEEAERILKDICPETQFYNKILNKDTNRKEWFFTMKENVKIFDFIFIDPDNGIKFSDKPSIKHIHIDEILELWNDNHSIIIYQHFPHFDREVFQYGVNIKLAKLLQEKNKDSFCVSTLKVGDVIYLFLLQNKHVSGFNTFVKKWKKQFDKLSKVKKYREDIKQEVVIVSSTEKKEIVVKLIDY